MTRQDLVNKSIDKLNTVKEALELINILEYDECIAALTGTKNLPSEIHSALMRRGKEANGGKTTLAVMENGEKVQCYGYYNDCNGVKWLYVVYKNIVGYASSKYLSK